MLLGACFTGRLYGLIAKWCITTAWSRHGTLEYVHVNTSWFYFKNSMYVPFYFGDMFLLMKVGRLFLSKLRFTYCSSSRVPCPSSSNSRGAFPCMTDSRYSRCLDRLCHLFGTLGELLTLQRWSWRLDIDTLALFWSLRTTYPYGKSSSLVWARVSKSWTFLWLFTFRDHACSQVHWPDFRLEQFA